MSHPKLKHFELHAPYVYEDGTYDDLCKVVMKHEQENPEVIAYAGEQISNFINFYMSISTDCYSLDRGEYVHIPEEGENLDEKNIIVKVWQWGSLDGKSFHINDETDDPVFNACLRMEREWLNLSSDDKEALERIEKYGNGTYGYFLSKFLDGEIYFEKRD